MSKKLLPGDSLHLYRRLLRYVLPHWRVFLTASLALIIVAGSEAAFAALIKPMMDGTFVERDSAVIKWAPVVMIVLFLFNGVASYGASMGMQWVARRVIKTLRGEMFRRLLKLPVVYFDSTASGNLISKLIYDVEQVSMASTEAVSVLIRDTLTVIALLGWMLYLNWQLALILFLGAPIIAKVINTISGHARRYSSRIQHSVGDVAHVAEEAIEAQRVVKTFGGQAYETARFDEANERNRRLTLRLESNVAASVPIVQFIAATASAGIIYVATLESMLDKITPGSFVSFLAAMMMMYAPTKRLTRVTVVLQRGLAAAESIFGFLDTPLEVDEGKERVERARGAVEYRDVTFHYNDEQAPVLHEVNLNIAPGQTVALVGRSGSGKSTMVGLLPRFYDVQRGRILLDGVDIRDLELESLRDQIALVSQHIVLFNDTIEHNIAYGRMSGVARSEVERAAEAAHAMEFIRDLPLGLDTLVGENGVLLSGGQRQRIAIARALLKDAPILILDEATSALDTHSERHIQQALEALMKNRTTLVIAHRLSTIEGADLIAVMEKGRIVEAGKHRELLARNGHYAALHNLQFREEPAAVQGEG
ncbi:MAG: lipid A export permease/ATP-binding protein MsbA [Gammaproteobacteria bacterium HGW-Gammaproteobacteria-1]|jgi:subfamily B ATP-binding cassette protein MsbA|nr:MAG: lipid A export permease/ATP-binding protein MsbA [Gammaproteobacteria bacterium HGW-Gammaproteobacteria-1]